MPDTVALDQQARMFKLHQASAHVCSICPRPAAQPLLPQGQHTSLPVCLIMWQITPDQQLCLLTASPD